MEMTIRKVTLLWKRASVSDGNIDQEEFYAQNKDVEEMMKRSKEEYIGKLLSLPSLNAIKAMRKRWKRQQPI